MLLKVLNILLAIQMIILLDLYVLNCLKCVDSKNTLNSGGKNMLFMVKDDSVLVKYSDIWNKIKELTGKRLHGEPFYDNKYIKLK